MWPPGLRSVLMLEGSALSLGVGCEGPGNASTLRILQLQGNDPHSVQISSSAAPILEQEALSAQTADIDAVSGATSTSASYAQSLQSALDKLGFKAADGSVATLQVP